MLAKAGAIEKRIMQLIIPTLEAMGYDLVRVKLFEKPKQRSVQVMAERHDGKQMTVEDCTTISHQISAVMDVEDPISGAYDLEVSTPGIDRPLSKPEDFERFKGFDAKVELGFPVEGRRRFAGKLEGLEEDQALMLVDGERYAFPVDAVEKAKLVLNDALLNAHASGQGQVIEMSGSEGTSS